MIHNDIKQDEHKVTLKFNRVSKVRELILLTNNLFKNGIYITPTVY